MRILMLSEFYLPIRGGIEQHVRSLSTELVARGHDVVIATVWQEGLPEYEEDAGVRVYRIRGTAQRAAFLFSEHERRHVPPLADPELVLGLRRVLLREQPDIVHAHNWLVHSFVPLKVWSKAPLVVTLHDYGLVCAKQRLQYKQAPCSGPGVKCLACAAAHYGPVKGIPTVLAHSVASAVERAAVDMFLPVSQAVADGNELSKSGLPCQVIPNFVPDYMATAEADNVYTSQLPRGDYMLFVGDVSQDKGVHILLQAYAGLGSTIPLVLIGRRNMTMPADAHNVHILPSMPHDAVMRAWSKSLLALAPSTWPDPCPTVVMEAMASGRPVIASRIGGLPDLVVDGETGLLVPPSNVESLRQAMQSMITHSDLRMSMGKAAQRAVVRFQASTVVPRVERVYEQLIGSKRA